MGKENRRLRVWHLVLALVLPTTGFSQNEVFTGNNLLEQCSLVERADNTLNDTDYMNMMFCLGTVYGVRSMTSALQTMARGESCIPLTASNGQVARIVVKYLRAHPSELHQDSALLVLKALNEAFPCEENE